MNNESDDLLIANAMRAVTKARFGEPAGELASVPGVVASASETLLMPAQPTIAVAHWTRGGRHIWSAPRQSSPQPRMSRRPR